MKPPFIVTWDKGAAGESLSVAAVRLTEREQVDALIRALGVFRNLLPETVAAQPGAGEVEHG